MSQHSPLTCNRLPSDTSGQIQRTPFHSPLTATSPLLSGAVRSCAISPIFPRRLSPLRSGHPTSPLPSSPERSKQDRPSPLSPRASIRPRDQTVDQHNNRLSGSAPPGSPPPLAAFLHRDSGSAQQAGATSLRAPAPQACHLPSPLRPGSGPPSRRDLSLRPSPLFRRILLRHVLRLPQQVKWTGPGQLGRTTGLERLGFYGDTWAALRARLRAAGAQRAGLRTRYRAAGPRYAPGSGPRRTPEQLLRHHATGLGTARHMRHQEL
jgi:hypothetical protein